jgi:hypothetical protein
MSKNKNWTKEEESFIIKNYAIMGAGYCAKQLSRPIKGVIQKANRLGVKRDGNFRYDRPKAPDGYIACWKCLQVLPEGFFYKKKSDGSYGKKTNLCKACNQESARKTYRSLKEKILARKKYHPLKFILQNIKIRAKKEGLEFNLTEEDLSIPDFCPVLGIKIIPFDNSYHSPSIDRLIPEKGYVKGNCNIISKKANMIKNCASLEEIGRLYDWMKSKLNSPPS